MDERNFYDEKEETKQIPLSCPHCRQENSYPVRWKTRTKKAQLPRGANDSDRAHFEKARLVYGASGRHGCLPEYSLQEEV